MLEFIAKYWLEFLFGLIASGLGVACKKIYKLYKAEKKHQTTKEQKEFYDGLQNLIKEGNKASIEGDQILQEQINVVKDGVLSIHKKNFKQDCRELLSENHDINLAEFEALQEEYGIYKSLGGNHDGDTLYHMVEEKATNNLTDNRK